MNKNVSHLGDFLGPLLINRIIRWASTSLAGSWEFEAWVAFEPKLSSSSLSPFQLHFCNCWLVGRNWNLLAPNNLFGRKQKHKLNYFPSQNWTRMIIFIQLMFGFFLFTLATDISLKFITFLATFWALSTSQRKNLTEPKKILTFSSRRRRICF